MLASARVREASHCQVHRVQAGQRLGHREVVRATLGESDAGQRVPQMLVQPFGVELEIRRRGRKSGLAHGRRKTGSRFSMNAATPSANSGRSISSRWRSAS